MMQCSYKFRFYLNSAQRKQLAQDFGCARYVWNHALNRRSIAYKEQGEKLTGVDLSREVTALKANECPWLKDANSTVLTQALRDQDRAFANFFAKRAKYPKFKKKHAAQSVRYQLDQRQLFRTFSATDSLLALPKLGTLNLRWSREVKGTPKMVTVSRDPCGRYFAAFGCEVEIAQLPKQTTLAGIDFGIKDIVVASDGFRSGNPKHLKKRLRQLKMASRRLSRKVKGSGRRNVQRARVARLHARVADARQDFLHKLTTKLIRENQAISIQPHNLREMMKNHRLARAIGDAGLGELTRQIRYKTEWHGRSLFEVNTWQRTTGVCPDTLVIGPKLALGKREWSCDCGLVHDRDLASSQVIAFIGAVGPEAFVKPMRVEGGRSRLAVAGFPVASGTQRSANLLV